QIEMVISQGIIQILTNLLMVTAIVVALYVLNWWLALIMTVFVVPLIFLVRLFAAAQRQAFRDQRMWMARINAYLNELITGVAIIQLFNRQRRNMEYFDQRNSGALEANLRVLFWYAVFEPTVVLFNAVTITAIIWVGGGASLDGAVSIGTLVAFISFMQRFFWPIRELSERYTMIQGAMASAERIFGVLDAPEEVVDSEGARPLAGVRGDIRFDHVWFAYEPENWVLKDVDFTIPAGQKVAIVGATGAGKSTTMRIMVGLTPATSGTTEVSGRRFADLPNPGLEVGVLL
ncbi:MAG: ABC transporter ATP-binding protein, partial [Dehalococcoidia bacterium]|nr:ABC transporter ATP-binding protein [Dehalococcoidia bacterium]